MDKGFVMLNASIVSGNNPFEFIQPGENPFNLPSSFVSSKLPSILRSWLNSVVFMWCDQLNTFQCKSFIERITVIGTIPDNSCGLFHSESFIDGSFDKGDFMWASRSRVQGECKTISVGNNHELRTFAALGPFNGWAPFFATAKVPSMKHSDKSIPPLASRSWASV